MRVTRRSVEVEVFCETSATGGEVLAAASGHRPDLPEPFDARLLEWADELFDHLEAGDEVRKAGRLVYEPNGEIVEIRAT